jgi:hypothetical protein
MFTGEVETVFGWRTQVSLTQTEAVYLGRFAGTHREPWSLYYGGRGSEMMVLLTPAFVCLNYLHFSPPRYFSVKAQATT